MTDTSPAPAIKVVFEVPGKETIKFMFYPDTKMLYLQEFIKRKIKLKATESIYLFDEKRDLISHTLILGDLLRPKNQPDPKVKIIVRKTETF